MTDEEREWLRTEFERCAPYIQAALDRDIGTHELSDVWDCIATGKAQFWPYPNSAIVTVWQPYPRKTVLRFWLCGGELKECVAAAVVIEDWAREAGADMVTVSGRGGWLRALPEYKKIAVYIAKAL